MDENSFNHLFLIMGTNPLPVVVVAEHFLKKYEHLEKIYIFYSEERQEINQRGTKIYADNSESLLKNHFPKRNLTFHTIPLSDISSAKKISQDMDKNLKKFLNREQKVHLNYTGGTKVMVTHIYRNVEEYIRKSEIENASFSYLDARIFRIINDKGDIINSDLRKEIKLTLEEIIKLHSFKRINKDKQFEFPEGLKKFKELIENGRLNEFFEKYPRKNFLNKNRKDKDLLCTKKSEVKDELKNMKAEEPFLSVVLALPEKYRLFNPDGSFIEPSDDKYLKEALEFIDGKWLEKYVYETLSNHFNDLNIYNNWEIKKSNWSGDQKFELDVIIVKGYQLIGISCTTSSERYICKSKGFEILTEQGRLVVTRQGLFL